MTTTTDETTLHESGATARRLGISTTYLHQLERALNAPAIRTSSGRRLFSEETIAALERLREERAANRRGSVPCQAA